MADGRRRRFGRFRQGWPKDAPQPSGCWASRASLLGAWARGALRRETGDDSFRLRRLVFIPFLLFFLVFLGPASSLSSSDSLSSSLSPAGTGRKRRRMKRRSKKKNQEKESKKDDRRNGKERTPPPQKKNKKQKRNEKWPKWRFRKRTENGDKTEIITIASKAN